MRTDSDLRFPRILCIAPLFAPTADSEAFCATKMVGALLNCGASVTVLSSSNIRADMPTDDSRGWTWARAISIDIATPVRPNRLDSIVAASQFQTTRFARWVATVVHTAVRLQKTKNFDVVYSRSLPMIAHVAGFWCAKKLGLPWVANINDPWELNFLSGSAYPKFSAFTTRAYMFWLRRTLLNADMVTYPCTGLHDFHAKLAKLKHDAEIIPHIGSRPELASHKPNGQFGLVHAGKLGTSEVTGRSAKSLLVGLKAFLEGSADAAGHTTLVLVGPEDEETQSWILKLNLQRNVQTVGKVNYESSLNYIASASVCILIESRMNESIFFPSKLADYLVCGKPVLGISPRIGLAADLASRGELLRVGQDDPAAVHNAISILYSEFKRGTLGARKPSVRVIEQLQGRSVAEKFLRACQALTSRPQTDHRPPIGTSRTRFGWSGNGSALRLRCSCRMDIPVCL